EGFLTAALPRASPLPWPSPFLGQGRLPLGPCWTAGVLFTARQTSLDAADCRLARPPFLRALTAGFDDGISPAAAALLLGCWAITETGLSPASPSWLGWTHPRAQGAERSAARQAGRTPEAAGALKARAIEAQGTAGRAQRSRRRPG